MACSKHPTAIWLSPEEAEIHCRAGVNVWRFCFTDEGLCPDVFLISIGMEVTFEVVTVAACSVYTRGIVKGFAGVKGRVGG